mgnify:CR=1 FL=1
MNKKNFKKIFSIMLCLAMIFGMIIPINIYAASGSKKITTPSDVSISAGYNSVTISFKKISGAKKYQIYQASKKNGKYKCVKTAKNTKITIKNLKTNVRYYFKVRAINGSKKSSFSKVVSIKTKLETPKITAKAKNESRIDISWKKVAGATGYEIYRSEAVSGKFVKISNTKKLSYSDRKLKAGTKYYYKVRAKKGKAYSKYSGIKNSSTKKHYHNYKLISTKAASCTEDGIRVYKCTCGDSYKKTVKATGHNYSSAIIKKQATCQSAGYKISKCINCDHQLVQSIPMINEHKYDTGVITAVSTATSEGIKTYTCSVCGKTKTETVPKFEGQQEQTTVSETDQSQHTHEYTKTVTKTVTCENDGIETYTCTCGDLYTKTIKAAGHIWDNGVVSVETTCETDGSKNFTCKTCGKTKTEIVKATGHDYSDEEVVTPPSCDSTGYKIRKCTKCGDSIDEKMPALEHQLGDLESLLKKPTCFSAGVGMYKCKLCGESFVREISKTTHEYIKELVSGATCNQAGIVRYTCNNCEFSYTDTDEDNYPKLSHKYEVTSETKPTCTEKGKMVYTCKNCGAYYTEMQNAVGHQFGDPVVTDPTCEENGYKIYTCNSCGYQKSTMVKVATGHNYKKTSIDKIPTCSSVGQETYTCTKCGKTDIRSLPVNDTHTWTAITENKWIVDKEAYDEDVLVGIRIGTECNICKHFGVTTIFWKDETYSGYSDYYGGEYHDMGWTDAMSYHMIDGCKYAGKGYVAGDSLVEEGIWEVVHHDEEGHYEDVITGYVCSECGKTKQ